MARRGSRTKLHSHPKIAFKTYTKASSCPKFSSWFSSHPPAVLLMASCLLPINSVLLISWTISFSPKIRGFSSEVWLLHLVLCGLSPECFKENLMREPSSPSRRNSHCSAHPLQLRLCYVQREHCKPLGSYPLLLMQWGQWILPHISPFHTHETGHKNDPEAMQTPPIGLFLTYLWHCFSILETNWIEILLPSVKK